MALFQISRAKFPKSECSPLRPKVAKSWLLWKDVEADSSQAKLLWGDLSPCITKPHHHLLYCTAHPTLDHITVAVVSDMAWASISNRETIRFIFSDWICQLRPGCLSTMGSTDTLMGIQEEVKTALKWLYKSPRCRSCQATLTSVSLHFQGRPCWFSLFWLPWR